MTVAERPLKERVHSTDATLHVGASGVEGVTDEFAERLTRRAGAGLIETLGNTATCH